MVWRTGYAMPSTINQQSTNGVNTMKQYKIWNNVDNTEYKGSNSFGTNEKASFDMLIGTSSKNSFFFGEITQQTFWNEAQGYHSYQLFIDGVAVKEAHYTPSNKTMKMWNIKDGVYTEYFNNTKKAVA